MCDGGIVILTVFYSFIDFAFFIQLDIVCAVNNLNVKDIKSQG
jgi:hypothetical protein